MVQAMGYDRPPRERDRAIFSLMMMGLFAIAGLVWFIFFR